MGGWSTASVKTPTLRGYTSLRCHNCHRKHTQTHSQSSTGLDRTRTNDGEMAMAEEWAEGGRWEGLKEREGAGETSGFLHSTAPTGRPQGGVIVGWFTYG